MFFYNAPVARGTRHHGVDKKENPTLNPERQRFLGGAQVEVGTRPSTSKMPIAVSGRP